MKRIAPMFMLFILLACSAVAQTVTAPYNLTSGQLPVATGTTTVGVSQILDNGHTASINGTSPDYNARFDVNQSDCSEYDKMVRNSWGIRIGCLSNGNQFIAMGINRTINDNNYMSYTNNNADVNHTILEFAYTGTFAVYQASHQYDGTVMNSHLIPSLFIGTTGNVGLGTNAPTNKLSVAGDADVAGNLSATGNLAISGSITASSGVIANGVKVNGGVDNTGTGLKHKRVSTGSIAHGATGTVTVTWSGTAFPDTNYTPVCDVVDANNRIIKTDITGRATGSVTVSFYNSDDAASHTAEISCIAIHD